jgi:hypothetical protein
MTLPSQIMGNVFLQRFLYYPVVTMSPTSGYDLVPNNISGDAMDASFEGLHVWSNNANTLSLIDDLTNLHELCGYFKLTILELLPSKKSTLT